MEKKRTRPRPGDFFRAVKTGPVGVFQYLGDNPVVGEAIVLLRPNDPVTTEAAQSRISDPAAVRFYPLRQAAREGLVELDSSAKPASMPASLRMPDLPGSKRVPAKVRVLSGETYGPPQPLTPELAALPVASVISHARLCELIDAAHGVPPAREVAAAGEARRWHFFYGNDAERAERLVDELRALGTVATIRVVVDGVWRVAIETSLGEIDVPHEIEALARALGLEHDGGEVGPFA